ncbi:MAG: FG-GAP repeat domain-containing protein, partial [Planctomycetota bacterium]
AVRRFTLLPAPGAFTLLTPSDQGMPIVDAYTFSWEAAAHADSYQLHIAEDADFNNIVAETRNTVTTLPLATELFQPQQTYHWRVIAENPHGAQPCAEAFSWQTPPLPEAPAPLAFDGFLSEPAWTCSWAESALASSYILRLSHDPAGNQVAHELTTTTLQQTLSSADFSPDDSFVWWVAARNAIGRSAFVRGGRVAWQSPAPFGQYPATDPSSLRRSPIFTWSASAQVGHYRLRIWDEQDDTLVVDEHIDQPTTTIRQIDWLLPADVLQPEQAYRWQVTAVGPVYERQATGSPLSFRTPARSQLAEPVLKPLHDPYLKAPVLAWQAVPGATAYQVQWDDRQEFCSQTEYRLQREVVADLQVSVRARDILSSSAATDLERSPHARLSFGSRSSYGPSLGTSKKVQLIDGTWYSLGGRNLYQDGNLIAENVRAYCVFPHQSSSDDDEIWTFTAGRNDEHCILSIDGVAQEFAIPASSVAPWLEQPWSDLDGDGDGEIAIRQRVTEAASDEHDCIIIYEHDLQQKRQHLLVPSDMSVWKWMDMDADGDEDLLIQGEYSIAWSANEQGHLSSNWQEYGLQPMSESHSAHTIVAMGNLDGDAWPDLAYAICDHTTPWRLQVLLRSESGTRIRQLPVWDVAIDPCAIAIADLDGDGLGELIIGQDEPRPQLIAGLDPLQHHLHLRSVLEHDPRYRTGYLDHWLPFDADGDGSIDLGFAANSRINILENRTRQVEQPAAPQVAISVEGDTVHINWSTEVQPWLLEATVAPFASTGIVIPRRAANGHISYQLPPGLHTVRWRLFDSRGNVVAGPETRSIVIEAPSTPQLTVHWPKPDQALLGDRFSPDWTLLGASADRFRLVIADNDNLDAPLTVAEWLPGDMPGVELAGLPSDRTLYWRLSAEISEDTISSETRRLRVLPMRIAATIPTDGAQPITWAQYGQEVALIEIDHDGNRYRHSQDWEAEATAFPGSGFSPFSSYDNKIGIYRSHMGALIDWADLDNDGHLDLILASGGIFWGPDHARATLTPSADRKDFFAVVDRDHDGQIEVLRFNHAFQHSRIWASAQAITVTDDDKRLLGIAESGLPAYSKALMSTASEAPRQVLGGTYEDRASYGSLLLTTDPGSTPACYQFFHGIQQSLQLLDTDRAQVARMSWKLDTRLYLMGQHGLAYERLLPRSIWQPESEPVIDLDGDGQLDLVTGQRRLHAATAESSLTTTSWELKIWRQDAGHFQAYELCGSLRQIGNTSFAAAGDGSGDGRVDLALRTESAGPASEPQLIILEGTGLAQERPQTPSAPVVTSMSDGRTRLSWSAASHDSTTFDLRLERPDGRISQCMPCTADGSRLGVAAGRHTRNQVALQLTPGEYRVQVQSVDGRRIGSPWSAATVFSVEHPASRITATAPEHGAVLDMQPI